MQGMIEGIPSSCVPSYARGLNILLVDHDQAFLTYLGSMLEQYSYKVSTAVLATDALAMLQQEKDRFKLVMASVNMPDMDTISFLRQLLRNDVPVILIAPERSVPAAVKALAEGASFYLDKPISMDDLKYIWQHVFTNKRKRASNEIGNPNSKIARISNRSVIKDVLNNASKVTATRDQIKDYISVSKHKNSEPSNALIREETMRAFNDPQGKGKQIVEDESTKKDSRTLSNQMSVDTIHGINNKSSGSSGKENSGDNVEEESSGNDLLKKKPRVVWSPELHLKFIAAVSKLGDKKARPKYILEAMNVPGLTHRQVASHLQKFKAQVERISKASERMDAETLRCHCSRFLTVSEILERSNSLLRALEKRNSRLITIPKETQNKDQQTDPLPSTERTNGIDTASGQVRSDHVPSSTKSPNLNEINQAPGFLRDFREMELDMDVLEAFYDSTSGHMNNANKPLESFAEVSAALNFSSGAEPNAENEPVSDDYLVDFFDKNLELDLMEVTENLESPSTRKQPLSDFTELLKALAEEAQGPEVQSAGPSQGDVDRYCELLENVLTEGSPRC